VNINHYEGAPGLGATAALIQFIEMSTRFRRRGIGTEVVHALAACNPKRR
jgi:hypothetical protein